MSSKPLTQKEKYDALLKEIRIQKSLPVLLKIYDDLKENKSHLYDDTVIPFQFSDDFIWFLKYNFISIQTQMDIFKLYIDEFFNLKCKPESLLKIKFIYDIFNYDSNFFSKASNNTNFLLFLNRFFNIYYPKKSSNDIKHIVGDYMDVFISEEREKINLSGWIQLKIKRIDEDKKLYIFEDYKDPENQKEIIIAIDNFTVQEKNTFVKEEEMNWRKGLKVGDKIDFLKKNKYWVEATVNKILSDNEIGINVLGEPEQLIYIFNKYSPFIQPYMKFSFKFQENDLNCMTLLDTNDDFQKFNYVLPITENNHLVPYDDLKFYSLEFYELLNFFINKAIETKILEKNDISIEYIYVILNVLCFSLKIINQHFIGEYFYKNCFQNLKKILLNFSLDKKTNKSKIVMDNIIIYLDKILGFIFYPFQLCKFLPEFIIEFGYNCFKNSEILEKRLLGLNNISKILTVLCRYFPILPNEDVCRITALISDKLLNDSTNSNKDLLGLLYNDPNIHEQLLIKGTEIIFTLNMQKFLDDKDIEKLYNLAVTSPADSQIGYSLYTLLKRMAKEISLSQEKVIFDKIMSFPYDKIRESDIDLMSCILQNVKTEEDFKTMTKTFLDYYYNYMVDFKKMDEKCGETFAKIMSYAKDDDNLKFLYIHFFERVINDLNNQNDLEGYHFFFTVVFNIFTSLDKRDEREKNALPFIKRELKKIYITNIKNMEVIVDKLVLLAEKNDIEKDEKKIEKYITDVININKSFLIFISEKKFYTIESLKKLAEYFIFCDTVKESRNNILYMISGLDNDCFDKNKYFEYFFNRFEQFLDTITPENPERYKLLDDSLIYRIFYIYTEVNQPESIKEETTEMQRYKNSLLQYTKKFNPLEAKYFDVIWKMFFKYNNIINLKEFLEDFSLKNFSPEKRHEIWENLVKKIFKNIDSNIFLSLKMLELILTISEKYGTAGAKSHFIDCTKKKIINLQFKNNMTKLIPETTRPENDIFYTTNTLYDIKSKIKNQYHIDPIFIDFETSRSKVNANIKLNENNKPLFQVFPRAESRANESFDIFFKRSLLFKTFPVYPIKKDVHESSHINQQKTQKQDLTDKFIQVLKEIFYRFAVNEKLDLNTYKTFFYFSLNLSYPDEKMEKEGIETFHKFDTEKKGYWSFDNFLMFFIFSINKSSSIMLNLYNLGYGPTLDFYLNDINQDSPLYYEENNVMEFMPRYFIGNNSEYMNKLFTYAKYEDKSIRETAQKLLQELCTMNEMKKTIFEKSEKIEVVISSPNLELRGYAFDILLTEFEKDEKDENSQKLMDNFINNNLVKLIKELGKFSENGKEEIVHKEDRNIIRYFNFYLANLKIIFYAFKNIIGNEQIIENIENFEKLNDDNDRNKISDINLELSPEKKTLIQNLQLDYLINIILSNLITIHENTTQVYKQGIRLSMKIMIYIILFSKNLSEKEKQEIYKAYTKTEITLVESSNFYTKRLLFLSDKLLLNLIKNEINQTFALTKFELMNEEMFNFKKLNEKEGKLFYFFKIYIDLLELSIKGTQNDKIFAVYENLLKLILDKNINIKERILIGYWNAIKEILTILKNENYKKLFEYDFEPLIIKFINEFILTFEKDENGKIVELNNLKNYSKYCTFDYITNIFQIVTIIISLDKEKYLKIFFLNEDIQNLYNKHLTKIDESLSDYNPSEKSRAIDSYIGLKNLSSICYMNSVLQQFFMIPLFRYAILSLPIPSELKEDKEDNDNLLFQLIRMFYYLNYSNKSDYNPKNFVFSFKDYDGNPTKVTVQCDAQEFLSRFIEKVEDCLKNNKHKFLCNNIFGGTTLQQVKCTNNECGNISERRENINFLSLDIKGVSKLEQGLEKFILEEKIEDYHCEKCDKKITNIKNVLIDKIPNILIIHLQRFAFSYETFNMEKINSYITFDKSLNIKKYTVNKDNDSIPLEYYDYDLQGVLIHSGTAQYGHYYSLISNGEKGEDEKWFKFNDSTVTKINFDNIIDDAYGNNADNQYGSSAYMLIYAKSVKKPVIINSKELDENLKKILEAKKDDSNIDIIDCDDGLKYYVYETEKEAVEKNVDFNIMEKEEQNIDKNIIIKNSSIQANLVSYEQALNLLKIENLEEKEKKPFLNAILLENIKQCNDIKFYNKNFVKFLKNETDLLKEIIFYDLNNEKINEYIPILKAINDYIIHIVSFSVHEEFSDYIIFNMISIYEVAIPKDLLTYLIKDIIEPNKEHFYQNYICSKEYKKGSILSQYIGRIICCCINNDIETELCMKIIQFYLDKIPVEITKKWLDMEAFNYLILTLVDYSDAIKKSFINNGIIAKLIDFIMGKESPLYQGDERIENKNNKPKFGNIVRAIALLYGYYCDNWEKGEVKLSKSDLIMINNFKFYEKVLIEDYNSENSNLLIDNKMKLDMILNNKEEENKDEFKDQIIDILLKNKIPIITKKDEIISGLNLVIHIIQKFSEIYAENTPKLLEKLNILLGCPVPTSDAEKAEIKYISGKYQDKYTILSKIYSQKDLSKDNFELLKSIFNLLNINQTVFNFIDKLPAPNSYHYSFVDYCIKLNSLVLKGLKDESDAMDDLEMKNPYKEFETLVNEICKKNNKDINNIINNDKIDPNNTLAFTEYEFNQIKLPLSEKVNIFLMKLHYISDKTETKTDLPFFSHVNYFTNLVSRKVDTIKEKEQNYIHSKSHAAFCILIYSKEDLDININFEPYINSSMHITAKKEYHYFIYSTSIDDKDKDVDNLNDKAFEFEKLKVSTEESKVLALPQGGENNDGNNEGCMMNCPACGNVNILDESNAEFKCVYCESPLF